jgi:uncharacterized membrane protein
MVVPARVASSCSAGTAGGATGPWHANLSRSLVPMRPEAAYRLALVMIPLSLAVGIIAAIGGVWLVVIIMALNLVFQTINLRASRRALRNRDSS